MYHTARNDNLNMFQMKAWQKTNLKFIFHLNLKPFTCHECNECPLCSTTNLYTCFHLNNTAILNELRHHRHWQAALGHLLGHQFSMLPSNLLPQQGMVLGGTMALQGQGLMLASFHGVNFRAKYWALFNIKDPYIFFSTESQKIPTGGGYFVCCCFFFL